MNRELLSLKYDRDKSFFSVIYKLNIDRYNYIFGFDEDMEQSVLLYEKHIEELVNTIEEFDRTFDNSNQFGVWLVDVGIINNATNVKSINNALFSCAEDYLAASYKTILKLDKIYKIIKGDDEKDIDSAVSS